VVAMLLCMLIPRGVAALPPEVTNVQAQQIADTYLVDIVYDLADSSDHGSMVHVLLSIDGGNTWTIPCPSVSGDAGQMVLPGPGRHVIWDAEQDYPGFVGDNCRVRVVADDDIPPPEISFARISPSGWDTIPIAPYDTIGFGEPLHLYWQGSTGAIAGMSLQRLAEIDTIYPYDDGLYGYKYRLMDEDCDDTIEDCWHPRRFNEATGDSFSYYGQITELRFHNDGSGSDLLHQLLPSGIFPMRFDALDVARNTVPPWLQGFDFVVNYDPETLVLDGQADWAHPEDPQVYPYYTLLNDPAQERHPFGMEDTIPDRAYVVCKALMRDDPRDLRLDPQQPLRLTGQVRGVLEVFGGGLFSYETDPSAANEPTWGEGIDGWYADTLGFMPGPNTHYVMNLHAVDEHGRLDGTPAELSFHTGYAPCTQGVELLGDPASPSAWDEALPCAEPGDTSHPCFTDTTALHVNMSGEPSVPGRETLAFHSAGWFVIDKYTHTVAVLADTTGQTTHCWVIPARRYRMKVLLHGRDHPDERWADPLLRIGGWQYQVDYECDPFNAISDGGGIDDIALPTWGSEEMVNELLEIEPDSGLWALHVDVAVPIVLLQTGPTIYRDGYLLAGIAGGDPEIADLLFELTTRQSGLGAVRAIAHDQTSCEVWPVRPARYHYFEGVRPSAGSPPPAMTWRHCNLPYSLDGIKGSIDLWMMTLPSNEGVPVQKFFHLVWETPEGDFGCGNDP